MPGKVVLDYLIANWVELAGFTTTAAGIWLTTKRRLLCWPVTLAADIFYLVVFFRIHLYSDALLQCFFIAFTLYGWWHWWRGVVDEGEVRIAPLGRARLLVEVLAGIAGTFLLGWLMKQIGASLPFLDAALASFSLVGSWWQAHRHIANWWLWIAVDLVYIPEYIYKQVYLTAVLSAILVVLAVMGLLDWRRAERQTAQTAS